MLHAGLPDDQTLDQTELKFLEDFCNLLTTAHYRLLTEEEWQTATDEEFTASSLCMVHDLCEDAVLLQLSLMPSLSTSTVPAEPVDQAL